CGPLAGGRALSAILRAREGARADGRRRAHRDHDHHRRAQPGPGHALPRRTHRRRRGRVPRAVQARDGPRDRILPHRETEMTAIACALLSAIGFYFSIGLGDQWWLAWLAPVPVLWFAFGETSGRQAFFAAWLGCALGSTSILRAYGGVMPLPII